MPISAKKWTHNETLALAVQKCSICFGLGVKNGRGYSKLPCPCVYRSIFRACYRRYLQCQDAEQHISKVTFDVQSLSKFGSSSVKNSRTWGYKNNEFVADFQMISKRILGAHSQQYRLFKWHFIQGQDWKVCTVRESMTRGEFFTEVYLIERDLGKAFKETEPYALFPLDEYFGAIVRGGKRKVDETHPLLWLDVEDLKAERVLRFPIALPEPIAA